MIEAIEVLMFVRLVEGQIILPDRLAKLCEATGDRLREAQHINRSLSALADVVVAKDR